MIMKKILNPKSFYIKFEKNLIAAEKMQNKLSRINEFEHPTLVFQLDAIMKVED